MADDQQEGQPDKDTLPGETSADEHQQSENYGPFHRLRSPTQSDATAKLQVQSQEIWGRPRRGSDIPQVQSYVGPLPPGERGIEFYTHVPPDRDVAPGQARWTGPRPGVTILDDFARISVVITKNTQTPSSAEASTTEATTVVEEEDFVMVA